VRLWLNVLPQAELAIGTHVTVMKTHALVSDVHHDVSNINAVVANIHTVISDMRRELQKREEGSDDKNRTVGGTRTIHVTERTLTTTQAQNRLGLSRPPMDTRLIASKSSISGETPPPPPRALFGRGELIEKIVSLAESLTPIALIGTGGIGKTSIALTVLHDNRVEKRFGNNRRFIRCDRFPPLPSHFLRRLSKVIGAGIENPEDLAPLRPFLSSKMIIILDNAESILDPQGSGSQEIYDIVEELSQSRNICLCITSRNLTVPPHCEVLNVQTLSVEAGRDAFYQIYKVVERSDLVNNILEQLDFHPLSINLLATVAQRNTWDPRRLTKEWERQRTGVLRTSRESLAATIELSLTSPTFQELGPDARGLLGVIAFFPQGINEDNFEWLFPTISDGISILDTFCILSLAYRSDGHITMLAPLRDHLRPKDPMSSPHLCMAKESYFTRLSVELKPNRPSFAEARWITSEDANVEHLLDIFTTIDANSDGVWDTCASFMKHLSWYKVRLIVLSPKIEGLPDDHRSKPECLLELARLFALVGNRTECKKLLDHALNLWRERGDDRQVARILANLTHANRQNGLHEEGIQQAKEASEVFKRLGDTVGQAECLEGLALVLCSDEKLDAAEEAASLAIKLLSEEDEQHLICQGHRILGDIYGFKGNGEKAIDHFEVALRIASSFNWHDELFWTHFRSARLSIEQDRFDDADAHIEHAKSHVVDNGYRLGSVVGLQAYSWYRQRRLEEARFEALCAMDVLERLGAAQPLEDCRRVLQGIEEDINSLFTSKSGDGGELLEIAAHVTLIDFPCSEQATESE